MFKGDKKSKNKKTPVEDRTTQVVGEIREVDDEKKETGEKSKVSHEGGYEHTGDSITSFNQEEERHEIGPVEQGDCANDALKSISKVKDNPSPKTTDNSKYTETTTNKASGPSKRNIDSNDVHVSYSMKTTDDVTYDPHERSNNDVKDSPSERITDECSDNEKDYPLDRNNSKDCHSLEIRHKIDRADNTAYSESETECHENPTVTFSKSKNFTSNQKIIDKRDEHTQTKNEAEWHEDPEVSENKISIPDKRDEQTQTQDPQIKDRAVKIVLAVYGLLITLLFYFVLSLNAPYSPIHVPPTTDEVSASKKISDISQKFEALKLKNSKLESKLDNLERDMQIKKNENSNLSVTVENLQQMVEYLREKVPSLAGKMKWMEQEQTEQGNYILLFLVIFLLIFLGITYLVMRRKETQPGQVEHSRQLRSNVGRGVHTSVLDQIRPKSLDKTIGIVSFNSKTQKVHKEMLQRALNSIDTNTEIVTIVVDRTDRILTIHPSCLVFIFVDRNDRNIILEDPDSEIGDLRRLTTQCVMKMGASVVVVYVNDKESRDLHGRDLYNPSLQSVKRHPVLKELQADGRVFSVMDSFNQNQNNHINKLLKKSGL